MTTPAQTVQRVPRKGSNQGRELSNFLSVAALWSSVGMEEKGLVIIFFLYFWVGGLSTFVLIVCLFQGCFFVYF